MAHLIKVDGTTMEFDLPINDQLTILQNYVGGYIEIMHSSQPGFSIICDEEGKLKNKEINYKATILHWYNRDPLTLYLSYYLLLLFLYSYRSCSLFIFNLPRLIHMAVLMIKLGLNSSPNSEPKLKA